MRSRVEILYFDGCPGVANVVQQVHTMLAREGVTAEVELRRVVNEEDARAARFLGSPTVRVNGRDVEPDERDDFGMKCRLYRTAEGLQPVPPESWLVEAVRDASG